MSDAENRFVGDATSRLVDATNAKRRREAFLWWGIAAFVLAVYAVGQVALLQGPHPYDPAKYYESAADFPQVPPDLWNLRIGVVAPVALAIGVFGESEAALYAVPIVVGLVLAGAVYTTMLQWFRHRVVAACAALVAVLNTNFLLNSSHIFPDTAATATFTAAFALIVFAAVRSRNGAAGRTVTAAVVAAGVLLGWTYLIRDFSPLLLPAVVAAVLLLGYTRRHIALLAAAAVGTAALDPLYGLAVHGDALVHARVLRGRGDTPPVQNEFDSVFDVLLLFPRLLLSWRVGWLFLLLAVVFVAGLVWFRDRRLWILAAWFFGFWVVMTVIGIASLPSGRWILNVSNIRYWYPGLPALVMGAFASFSLVAERLGPARRAALLTSAVAASLALVIVVPGVAVFASCSDKDVWPRDPAARWEELRQWLSTAQADRYSVIWTDDLTQRLVPTFARSASGHELWDGRVEQLSGRRGVIETPPSSPTSLLLVHVDRIQSVTEARGALAELRADWTPLFATQDAQMLVLAHRSTVSSPSRFAAGAWWRLTPEPENVTTGCGLRPGHPRRA